MSKTLSYTLRVPFTTSKNAKKIALYKSVYVATHCHDFGGKNSAHCNWLLVLTELAKGGTHCHFDSVHAVLMR